VDYIVDDPDILLRWKDTFVEGAFELYTGHRRATTTSSVTFGIAAMSLVNVPFVR
jgi:hypothetical protein